MFMVVQANSERVAELRVLGEILIVNARRLVEPVRGCEPAETEPVAEIIEQQLVPVRAWASSLDRDSYQAHETQDGFHVQTTPPDDVVEALQDSNEDLEFEREAIRLFVRYFIDPTKEHAEAIGADELVADVVTARKLVENQPSRCVHSPWDTSALVAAAVLEAHLVQGVSLPDDALSFAAETVLRIGEGAAGSRQFEFEGTFFEDGADRSAARVLPLLLLPVAANLRAVVDEEDGSTTFERAFRVGINLARAVADEVRLHLARGLDHVWETPCMEHGRCHHELGWRIATETMRFCVLSAWDPETGRRSVLALEEPFHRVAYRYRRLDPRVSARRGHTSASTSGRGQYLRLPASPGPSVGSPRRSAAVFACLRARRGSRSARFAHSRERTRATDAGQKCRRCSRLRAYRCLR